MGDRACDLLTAELALDRLEAEVAAVLPAYQRSFATAHAAGARPPAVPAGLLRASIVEAVRHAGAHPVLADRALALARLVVPIAIDRELGVAGVLAARASGPTWDDYAALARAREAAAHVVFSTGFVELMHRLAGVHDVAAPSPDTALPAPIPGWHDAEEPRAATELAATWGVIAARHGVRAGAIDFVAAHDGVRPRTFVVEPGHRAIVVVPASLASPAAWFAALHELGHAVVALVAPAGVPRVVDEAAASFVARAIEQPGGSGYSALATAARRRRRALAAVLDAIERAVHAGAAPPRPTARPPWALWHDAGAQAAYVAAEQLADRWATELGAEPGALARAIATERAHVDARTPR